MQTSAGAKLRSLTRRAWPLVAILPSCRDGSKAVEAVVDVLGLEEGFRCLGDIEQAPVT